MIFKAHITAMLLCGRSQDSVHSVSVRRVHFVFLTAGFKVGRNPCPRIRETATLQRGIRIYLKSFLPVCFLSLVALYGIILRATRKA